MIKLSVYDIILGLIYSFFFGVLLLVYGLEFNQSLSLGLILGQFYLTLVKIHHRIRR